MFLAARNKSVLFSDEPPKEYWTKINDAAQKGEAEEAEKLLFKMPQLFEQGLLPTNPTVYEYNMVLNAWSRTQSAEAPQRAEQILAAMWENFESGELDTKPDAVSYSTVLNCWAKARQQGAADRAEVIFREMQDRYKAGDEVLKPNVVTYSSLINVYANWKSRNGRSLVG